MLKRFQGHMGQQSVSIPLCNTLNNVSLSAFLIHFLPFLSFFLSLHFCPFMAMWSTGVCHALRRAGSSFVPGAFPVCRWMDAQRLWNWSRDAASEFKSAGNLEVVYVWSDCCFHHGVIIKASWSSREKIRLVTVIVCVKSTWESNILLIMLDIFTMVLFYWLLTVYYGNSYQPLTHGLEVTR